MFRAPQAFKVQAFKNGKFIEVTEQSLTGKWSAFIFMPAAFKAALGAFDPLIRSSAPEPAAA